MEFETASQVNPTNVTDSYVINVSTFHKCVETFTMSPRCVMSKGQYHFSVLMNK